MIRFFTSHITISWLLCTFGLAALLFVTSPQRIGPTGVTIFFAVFYLWTFLGVEAIIRLLRPNIERNLKRSAHFFMTAVLALIPTFIIGLQSLNQLVWRDVAIILSLAFLVIFYWIRRGYN